MSQNSQRYGQPLENCSCRSDSGRAGSGRRPGIGKSASGSRSSVSKRDLRRRRRSARHRAARSARRWRRRSRRHGDSRTPDTFPARRRPTGRRAPTSLPAALARRAMSRICGAWICMPLTNTTSAQAKSLGACRRDILVDEADRPWLGHIGGDQQQPLRRHEGAHPSEQVKSMRKRAEGRRIGGKNAKDAARIASGQRVTQRYPS